ncbi:hypothetical protein M1P56_16935 [Streptomyces sp. HU2014]|uniref:hypothetical protein n=1 Tax=Streptomyces sp. HU2014 TaxID=2939414 RepID=UPI00200E12A6|nr:hypothetical protein [Streptomyces sp. HU2014]UQI45921.1 hypothetical protein M1P56_16935 [Streptomyces sp. HU2014]
MTTHPRGTDRRLAAIEQDLTAPAPQGPTPDHHAPWPSTTYTLTTGLRHLTDTMTLYNTQEDVVGSLMAVVARLTSS